MRWDYGNGNGNGHSSWRDYVNQLVLVSEGSEIIHGMVRTWKKVTAAASGVIDKVVKPVDFGIILRLFLRAARVFEWPSYAVACVFQKRVLSRVTGDVKRFTTGDMRAHV